MKKLDLDGIKNVELNILLEFQKYCEENNIRFTLCGGTMLGAIRHKGFIPWDDDIDLHMPRPDYNRLIDMTKQNNGMLNDHLKLVCLETKTLDYPFGKVLDIRTKINQKYSEDASTSLWIDIVPMDGLPEDEEETSRLYKSVTKTRDLLALYFANPRAGKTKFKRIFKRFVIPFVRLRPAEYYSKKIDDESKQYDYESSKYVGAVSWGLYGPSEKMLKSEYEEFVEVDFEGYKMPAPSCWKSYLENLYGDYMQLPPESARKMHILDAWIEE